MYHKSIIYFVLSQLHKIFEESGRYFRFIADTFQIMNGWKNFGKTVKNDLVEKIISEIFFRLLEFVQQSHF